MIYTNVSGYGGQFIDKVSEEFENYSDVAIASGYASYDILKRFEPYFHRVAENGGSAQLLLGMAFYEGLSQNKLDLLKNLSSSLQNYQNSGVYVCYSGKFHGKVYKFSCDGNSRYYLGSSNFSHTGLSGNIECTAQITEPELSSQVDRFLDFIFDQENATLIEKAEITVPGTTSYRERTELSSLDDLQKYDVSTIDKSRFPHIAIDLSRMADTEKSNLNAYFGKGRWSRATDVVRPRPWYEVEIICNRDITSNPLYPKGEFEAYTDDGFIMPMKTSGDYHKNLRSRGNLRILGMWIKGKLQKSGALLPLTPVTQDTLDQYGNTELRLYKIDEGRYYMEF